MEFQEIVSAILPVVTMVLGGLLSHHLNGKQRLREDQIRQAQEQREEQRRREAGQHDWLATEHRRLIYEVGATAFAARNAIARMHGNDPDAVTEAHTALGEFQNTFRRAKLLASAGFDDVCVAAHACLVEAVVSGTEMIRRGGLDGAEDRQRSWQAIKRFDAEHWPAIVIAARQDWQRGVALDPVANPLV